MKVSDILRVKGNTLYTITPEDSLADAARIMDEKDIGSLVVLSNGRVVGMLTFREVIRATLGNGGSLGTTSVYRAMDPGPLICTLATEMDDVRRMMLDTHARYMPVIESNALVGVVSFYDVAKAVVDAQNFENRMLKAYIRDWPENKDTEAAAAAPGSRENPSGNAAA
ncbi:MAG: CBS domain-containing protein [Burkholderiaceae bacterium]|jgi:CBS domain-containing protein|nr:CBS domain-containing protein [Burkholderiaceae bacterium]